mgnify:CR=1 FL=1
MMLALQIAYKELDRRQTKELNEKRSELQSVRQEIASVTVKANEAAELLDKINAFVSSFRLAYSSIIQQLIKEGLCCFPRLMRWKTSKGEVAPVFIEKSNGYSYLVYGYMNVETKEYYSKEMIRWEIKAGNRTGTIE